MRTYLAAATILAASKAGDQSFDSRHGDVEWKLVW